jgi:hypothetical protein
MGIWMKASELAKRVGRSRSQIARIAASIPGHKMTRGGHHYFMDCPALQLWLDEEREQRLEASKRKNASLRVRAIAHDVMAQRKAEKDRADESEPEFLKRLVEWSVRENAIDKESLREEAHLNQRLGFIKPPPRSLLG